MSFDLKTTKKKPIPRQSGDLYIGDYLEDDSENERGDFSEETQQEASENIGDVLHVWQAPEFEVYEKSGRWYAVAAVFILAMVGYALLANSPIMAITFILLAVVGYIHAQRDPRDVTFSVTDKGVQADKELYLYENIHSFWIFYEPTHTKTISLHTKAAVFPFVHIPIGDEDPVELRDLLLQNIPEIKQNHSLIDTLERVLHI